MQIGIGLSIGGASALSVGLPPLLVDDFEGAVAAISGREPNVGPDWSVTGAAASGVVAGGGQMYNATDVAGVYYSVSALQEQPKEIGCRFLMTDLYVAMRLGGTFEAGKLLAIQVLPSGVADASYTQINYTTQAGDLTLSGVATAYATVINANAAMIAAGITATAVGQDIQLRATNSPRIRTVFATSPVTASTTNSFCPTLACYPTGQNFLTGMVHFRLDASGYPDWTVFNSSALTLSSITRNHFKGMQIDTEYTYRCVLDGEDISGGVWDSNGDAVCTVSGSDSRIPGWSGASAFWEGGDSRLRYKRAWAARRANQTG